MARLIPTDAWQLAKAVADSLMIASDPEARDASLYYWQLNRKHVSALVDAVMSCDCPQLRREAEQIVTDPPALGAYDAVKSVFYELLHKDPKSAASMAEIAWAAECYSRIAYHHGTAADAEILPVRWQELAARHSGHRLPVTADPPVLIVIPFRDRTTDGARVRNLLACLLGLRDQSAERHDYRVTVVETDLIPRWRDVIEPFCDHYVFAPCAHLFNKSWAVNSGIVHSPGSPALICIHDADVLSDFHFVTRNMRRFLTGDNGAHLPYSLMSCLDAKSSALAIRGRRTGDVDLAVLRAYQLRRPPGACLWLRADIFHRIGGMDERYEGWGGEDNDLFRRAEVETPFNVYDDALLHLRHPPSAVLDANGEVVNAHIPPLSWVPSGPIGELTKYVRST